MYIFELNWGCESDTTIDLIILLSLLIIIIIKSINYYKSMNTTLQEESFHWLKVRYIANAEFTKFKSH